MRIQVSAAALDTLARGFKEAPALVQRELLKSMTTVTQHLEGEVQDAFPVAEARPVHPKSKRTPKGSQGTRGTIFSDAFSTPAGVLGVVASPSPIALFVEEGTKAHKIAARYAKALAFPLGVSGGFGVAKSVQHPGTKPQKVFEKTLNRNEGQIVRELENCAARIARQLGDG